VVSTITSALAANRDTGRRGVKRHRSPSASPSNPPVADRPASPALAVPSHDDTAAAGYRPAGASLSATSVSSLFGSETEVELWTNISDDCGIIGALSRRDDVYTVRLVHGNNNGLMTRSPPPPSRTSSHPLPPLRSPASPHHRRRRSLVHGRSLHVRTFGPLSNGPGHPSWTTYSTV